MKFAKDKIAIVFALFLMFAMAFSLVALPAANAHTPPWNIQLIAFCIVAPNPVGLGQSVNVGFWLNQPTPTAVAQFGDRWTGITVKVTKPDDTTESLGPFTADATGGTHYQYTPSQLGEYKFQMTFPGQTLAGDNPPPVGFSPAVTEYIGDNYLPATSNVATLTVQQEPVGEIPNTPLPTQYWQTPVNALNVNNWYTISGAYLTLGGRGGYNASSNYNPYTLAPTTSHILWTQPEAFGGALGGEFGGSQTSNYYSTRQYEKMFSPVIMNGYLYYTVYPGSSTTPTANICVDLYTGQTVWINNAANYGGGSPAQSALTSSGLVTSLMCGQILDYVSPNQYGGLAYLWTTGTPVGINSWGTTYNMFDAKTGTYILSIVNGSRMTLTEDENGNLIGYYNDYTNPNAPTLNMWNSTLAIILSQAAQYYGPTGPEAWVWRPPQGAIIPFSQGIAWSMPLATNISGKAIPPYTNAPGGLRCINSGVIVEAAFDFAGGPYFQSGYGIYAGYSSTTGQQLWIKNITMTPFTENGNTGASAVGNGVWTIPAHQDGVIQGYSLTTGEKLWETSLAPFDPYDTIGGYMANLANGTLYLAGFGGDIWSINMLTGKINWYTNTTKLHGSSEANSPYGVWPIWGFSNGGVAGGILFLEEGHEYSPPLFHGAQQLAVNCTTGELVWSIDAFDVNSVPAFAYGVMTTINAYDNQIYAYGKGPSATTVTASPKISVNGDSVLVEGMVTDISAGSKQQVVAANFPNGLPCVSDANMSDWMEYVYMQQPKPTNATGVKVTITVLDPNNNSYDVATATSDDNGFFSTTFTPPVPGKYTIYATFTGSGSYYGSSAVTALNVEETPQSTPASTPLTASLADIYFLPMSIGIIIAIIVVGLLIVLMLRKR